MVDQDRTPKEADHEPSPPTEYETQRAQGDRRQQFVLVQPHQLRKPRQIAYSSQIGGIVPPGENPADVAVKESVLRWRMNILFGIRMKMMMSVFCGPPENALLRRRLGEQGEQELKRPAGRVGAM